jgi:hypothetical protein
VVNSIAPAGGQLDSGSGQFGGQCRSYGIDESFTGTVTLEVVVTPAGGSAVRSQASASVIAPELEIEHITVTLDQSFYEHGETAQACFTVSPQGADYTYEVYIDTFLFASGSGTGGETLCGNFTVEDLDENGVVTVEVFAFQGSTQISGFDSAQIGTG